MNILLEKISSCQYQTGSEQCIAWVAQTPLDRHVLAICFILMYLVNFWIATLYSTKLSTVIKVKGSVVQTKLPPKKEHTDPSVYYLGSQMAGGYWGLIAYTFILYTSPWFWPSSYDKIVFSWPNYRNSFALLILGDLSMYLAHRLMHSTAALKRLSGHYKHHQIISPTAYTAAMGSLMESILLAWLPVLFVIRCLPFLTFTDMYLTNLMFQVHLIAIHSDTSFVYDNYLDKIGFVTVKTHHVHHLRQKKNLGHVLWIWDYVGGTFMSWEELQDDIQERRSSNKI